MNQDKELEKYKKCYLDTKYRMCRSRLVRAKIDCPPKNLSPALDVSCGRGEWIQHLKSIGIESSGTETVDYLLNENVVKAVLPVLPFNDGKFRFVSCLDVLEHIPEEITEASLLEIKRIGSGAYLIAVAIIKDTDPDIGELHINLKPKDEWDFLIFKIFGDFKAIYTDTNIQYRIGY